jgi:hypothetical protein
MIPEESGIPGGKNTSGRSPKFATLIFISIAADV